MLKTRLWMGAVLIALTVGMLVFDQNILLYPFQFVFQLGLAWMGCSELIHLLGKDRAPIIPLCKFGVVVLTLANWALANAFLFVKFGAILAHPRTRTTEIWACMAALATAMHLLIFIQSMIDFREGNQSFERMARTWWVIGYLGLLPSFFAQIRWLHDFDSPVGTTALALAIFVPKGCDIGAYFTGRLFGKHPMAPVLSPKKTWEGASASLVVSIFFGTGLYLFAIPINSWLLKFHLLGPDSLAWNQKTGLLQVMVLSAVVNIAAQLGDLVESAIKRGADVKDSGAILPGHGGMLDRIDAMLFAAPVLLLGLMALR